MRQVELTDRTRNGDPLQRVVQLEGESQNIEPGDLGDGNAIGDGQRSVQNTLSPSDYLVQRGESSNLMLLEVAPVAALL